MSTNSLRAANDEIYENSTIVNSLADIKNFLAAMNVKKFIIEKMAQSFMAKIPAGTRVELVDNILKVGESLINLGEAIYQSAEKTQALMTQTQTRAMAIVNHNLPAKVEKKPLVAVNDENYRMAA